MDAAGEGGEARSLSVIGAPSRRSRITSSQTKCCLLFKLTTLPDSHIDTLDRPGDTLELDPYDQDIELGILDQY